MSILRLENAFLEQTGPQIPLAIFPGSSKRPQNDFLLSYTLQSSLHLETMIEQFLDGIKAEMPLEGIHYTHEEEDISIKVGKSSHHYFKYRLQIGDEYLGDVKFIRRTRFEDEEVDKLEKLLCILVYPVRNALQYRRALQGALQDPLTGVGNRASFKQHFHREMELAKRYDLDLTLIAIDIDHFKKINDTYGHSAGDKILNAVAGTIDKCIRECDLLFRSGGEEFTVILGNTDYAGAKLLADRIRFAVEKMRCRINKKIVKVTLSAGIAALGDGDNDQTLFDRADKNLYQAKRQGRNRVCG